jgi:sugar O-acyltransferase (sialic acid O-acetyltransferase NeuD family)
MKDLYIIGASGLACEVANYILDIPQSYRIAGFVAKDICKNENIFIRGQKYPVINEEIFFTQIEDENLIPEVVIAIGFPEVRCAVAETYKGKCTFPNIIHTSSILLDTNITLGEGNIITPQCFISTSVTIGNFNFFNTGVSVGHNVIIGNSNVFNTKSSISGNIGIGDRNLFGVNSSVMQGIKIGSGNVIGIGSVVLRKISDNTHVFGNPAKKII